MSESDRVDVTKSNITLHSLPRSTAARPHDPAAAAGVKVIEQSLLPVSVPAVRTVGARYNYADDHRKDADAPVRETWTKKADFLLSIIGFAVDLANVWRFPYLCYKNGGGAFLIPYFTLLICGAIPLFFMELVMGQYHKLGAIGVWKISPIFRGIGVAECMISFYVAIYYNVIIAWSVYYFIASFSYVLPWTHCDNPWNTEHCYPIGGNVTNRNGTSSTNEYFELAVLGLKEENGFDELGSLRWPLVACLMGVFTVLYFSLWKGVKSSGKVVWVTATLPYFVLTILLVRGLMLPGSLQGIMYFITPDMSKLTDTGVWSDAVVQIFYSVGAGFGAHIAYASYNKFENNCYRDCLITAGINSATSIFSGFVIFSYLGFMAQRSQVHISEVATEGAGLVFVVYPEAISQLPGSSFWSVLFFSMLIALGLDSAMGGLEAVLTALHDVIGRRSTNARYKNGSWLHSREALTLCIVIAAFTLALQNITNGGIYLFTMWDNFGAGISILFAVFCQSIAIGWVYGLNQFCDDVEDMLGFRPGIYWKFSWKFVSPLFLFAIMISNIIHHKPLSYDSKSYGRYIYPDWADSIGWIIAGSSMVCVPIFAIYVFFSYKGNFAMKLALSISPTWEHTSIKKHNPVTRFKKKHWMAT